MPENLAKLEHLIGHSFADAKLLERAVTHRSWAFENLPGMPDERVREAENESMEFLGDSVLGLVIAEQLFKENPKADEGDLTLMKHTLVSTRTLAKIAEELEISAYIRVGKGEEMSGGRKKQALLANTLEAIIGAVFLDAGYIKARAFVAGIFREEVRSATPRNSLDYKSMLQELLQGEKLAAPSYRVVHTDGPPHDRTFSVEASWATGRSSGTGNSIKSAEMMAAEAAIETLRAERAATERNA